MMNIIILEGRLTKEPKLTVRENADKTSVWCDFCLAVGRDYKREGKQDTDFILCRAFNPQARYLEKHGKKGGRIKVCGMLEAGRTSHDDGSSSYYTQVLVDKLWITDYKEDPEHKTRYPPFDPQQDPDRFVNVPDYPDLPFAD